MAKIAAQRSKEYRLRHPERVREKNKEYYWKNKEKENIRCKRYHWKNRETIKIRKDKYNPQYHNKINFNGMKEIILERDNWQCKICGMTQEQHILIFGVRITIDHINGNREDNSLDNLQTLCLRCHGHKDGLRNGLKKQMEMDC